MSLSNIQFIIIIIHSDSSFKNQWQIWEHFADLSLISGEMPLIIWMIFVSCRHTLTNEIEGLGLPRVYGIQTKHFKSFCWQVSKSSKCVTTMTGSMSDKTTVQAKMSETKGQLAGKLCISKLY